MITRHTLQAVLAAGAAILVLPGLASAQARTTTATPTAETKGYAEVVANSTFGNVTSQAYGGEIGYAVWNQVQLFLEGGQVRNAASSTLSSNAQVIAAALTQLQPSAVSYSVKQPINYFNVGLRFPFTVDSKLKPYVLVGGGIAQVKRDVSFALASSESLSSYVTLGDDLSGRKNSGAFTAGAGVMWPVYQRVVVDFQFRLLRVFAEGEGINVGRAGIGLGFQF